MLEKKLLECGPLKTYPVRSGPLKTYPVRSQPTSYIF